MLYDLFQLVSNKLISIDWCVDKNGEINKQYIVFKYRFGQTKKVEVKNGYAISKNIRFKIYDENIPIIENTEFENCIFLKNTSFDNQITYNIKFKNCIFYNTSFQDINFTKTVDLKCNKFLGDICFKNAIFETDAIFSNSKFYSPINFDHTSFKGLAIFDSCEFKENVVFLYTNIYETLSLRSTTFRRSLNLAYINLRSASKIESHDIKLAWKSIPSASIGYDLSKNENMWKELPKHKDIQETYRLLKLEAISKKDNILAIQFNQKEYEKHYLKLWWFKNIGNKFILFFDKNISNFGTSVLRVLLWFLAINLTLYLKYYYVFLYLLCIIVFCEILGLFIQICSYILRMKLDSFVSKFILNFIIEYRYLYFFYAILAFLVYKDMTIKPEPQYGFFESIYHLTISAINNVVSFFKHLSNFFVDNDKWQDQLNGFIQSFLPFTDIKDSISELLLQGCVNISLLYQVIKSFRKYSKKL